MQRSDQFSLRRGRILLACALMPTLFAGCGGGNQFDVATQSSAGSAGRETAVAPAPTGDSPQPPGYVAAVNPDLRSIVDAALDDAAKRTGRDRSTLVVVSSEAVVWPDGGLGCPEPGVKYTMAPVEGYRIRIQAGADLLDYHANRRGYLVHCPPGRRLDPLPGGST